MRTMFRTCLGLGILTTLVGPAMAQGRGFGPGGGLAQFLGHESVHKELKLDDKQVEKAKELAEKINEEMREKRQSLQDLEPQERTTKMQEIDREINAAVLKSAGEFLKPEQITRLKQISYQQRGIQAFSDPEVARKLNLTDAQKTDIRAIQQESMEEMRTAFQENQDDADARTKKISELRKLALAKAEAKLNDEQQKTWKELLGPLFEWPPRRP